MAGDFLGEISLLEQTRRTATVVAKGARSARWSSTRTASRRCSARVPALRSGSTEAAFDRLAHEAPDQSAD